MLKVIYPGDTPNSMKSLEDLNKQADFLQLQIRKLVLMPYRLDEGIADKLTAIATIAELRTRLATIQLEIRKRTTD
jgi:hypothetical protein